MNKLIINTFKCYLLKSHVCDYYGSNKQVYLLTILHKNCYKIYLNDILVPKRNTFLATTYKDTQSIKIKLVGVFNSQTYFLEVNPKFIDVNFPNLKKSINNKFFEPIHSLTYRSFSFISLIKQRELKTDKKIEKLNEIVLFSNTKLKTELKNQNYNLTTITNDYEQANISNT